MNIYFPATFPITHGSSGGVIVVAKFEGATKTLTTVPVGTYSGWWSHKSMLSKANEKAKMAAFYDAATTKNSVHKAEIPSDARGAAIKAGLELHTNQYAWIVG